MKKHTLQKGFTLIELLVVVAIIALLAATILGSLNGARQKAKDARRQSELSSMRAQAELYYNNFGSYNTTPSVVDCGASLIVEPDTTKGSLNKLYADVSSGGTAVTCFIGEESWAIAASLGNGTYCVDSNGVSKPGVNTNGTPATDGINAISSSYNCN
jgi:prepilin-type N-terminal cleavage/methylation domain-containing protein